MYYHERTKFSAEAVDDYIKELKKGGHRVKAFFHCNPNNPLGDIYGEETTLNLMRVCKEHQIHFICDEIYASLPLQSFSIQLDVLRECCCV